MTYFLAVCIERGLVEMDIWSRIFAEKFRITFKVCVRTGRGGGGSVKCGQVWTGRRGVKNYSENVNILYRWPQSMLCYGASMNIQLKYLLEIFLTHIMALEIHEKTRDFLMFSGGIERDQCHETG